MASIWQLLRSSGIPSGVSLRNQHRAAPLSRPGKPRSKACGDQYYFSGYGPIGADASRVLRSQFVLRAHTKQFDDDLVLFVRQLLYRTAGSLVQDTVGKRSLQLRRDRRRAERLEQLDQRRQQVFDEMLDAALAASEMPLKALPHYAPPWAGAVAHRCIGVLDAQHALLNQIEHFAIERGLKAIRHVPGQFFVETNRPLADRCVERHRPQDRVGRRFRAADDFDERNDVRRIERMADEDTLGVRAVGLHDARRDA